MLFQSPFEPRKSCDGIPDSQESSLSEHEPSGSSCKRKERKWEKQAAESDTYPAYNAAVKRRKTRWSSDDSQLKRLGPLQLPDLERNDDTQQDLELEDLNRQLMEINNKLMRPDVMNNLECIRAELMKQKQKIISKLVKKILNLKSQSGSKGGTLYKKMYLPEKQYPGYNFVSLLKGPRGTTVKGMEAETGAKIRVIGMRPDKESKRSKLGKKTDPSKKKYSHVRIDATNQKSLDAATEMVEKLLVPVIDCENDHRHKQLYELAVLNGKEASCDICDDLSHSTQLCPLIASEPHTVQQGDPLSELGAGIFKFGEPVPSNVHPQTEISAGTNKGTDETILTVRCLPISIDEVHLKQLFHPFGNISSVKLVRDPTTGVSKGCGFVKFSDPASAAIAIEKMHGFRIRKIALKVGIADCPPTTPGSSDLTSAAYPGSPAVPSFRPPVPTDDHPASKEKGTDESNLFVGHLPGSIGEDNLKLMFDPFGTISSVKVVRDPVTGVSKGCAFVKYNDPASADAAIKAMHGFQIGNKTLAVRVAHRPTTTPSSSALPTAAYPGSGANPEVAPAPTSWTALPQHNGNTTPTVPSVLPIVSNGDNPGIGASSGTSKEKGTDEANLYVGYLPISIDEASLKPLFDPFGTVSSVCVVRDPSTGVSKGYGFIKYSDPASAAIAIKVMHGSHIGNKTLVVRVAHRPPSTACSSALPTAAYPSSPANPQATPTPTAFPQNSAFTTPTVPSFHPPVCSDVHPSIAASSDASKEKGTDEANLFVGNLPHSINEVSLKPLFDPFGTITSLDVVRDPVTGVSKRCGFVKYRDPASAAIAIEKMHGFKIGYTNLVVRVAHRPQTTLDSSALPTAPHSGSSANPQAISTLAALPVLPQHSGYTTPTVPSSGTCKEKDIDESNLFVGYLPNSMDESSLKRLFDPFGTVSSVSVLRDPVTGLSKGCGFVKYSDPASAATAIEKMHGFRIGKWILAVRVAHCPPTTPHNLSLPTETSPGFPANPQAMSTPTAWPALPQHSGYTTVPSFHPPVPSHIHPGIGTLSGTSKENITDEANLSVLNLPDYMDEVSLKRLFDAYGTISGVKIVKDPVTSLSKGYGFVRYRDPASAAIAIEKMHGLELGDNTLAVRIAGRSSATPGSSASAPGYPCSPANQVTLNPTVLSAMPQYTGYFTSTVPLIHPSVPGCFIPAAHVPPTPLAADNSTFHVHPGLMGPTKPMSLAFNRPTGPAFNGPTPPAQTMTAAVHSLHPGHSFLTTPGRPTVPVPPAVPGYPPSSLAQTTSLPYGFFVDRTTSDASSRFPSTSFTSSSLSGVKLPESIDVKDFQKRPVHLSQASTSRFSLPVTSNVTRPAPGTESFPGDPDTFRSRLL